MNLLQLATTLQKNRFDVEIIDCHLDEPDAVAWQKKLDEALLVGISAFTGFQSYEAVRIGKLIKEINPGQTLVWGGYHPSLWPEIALNSMIVDYVISGPGEQALLKLSHQHQNDRADSNRIIKGSFEDKIPEPAFELLDLNNYITPTLIGERVANINTSYGCVHNCSFCAVSKCFNQKWTAKPVDQVIDEIEFLISNYHIDALEFSDNAPFIDPARMLMIAETLVRKGIKIKWMSMGRVDEILGYSDEQLQTLIRSGFCRVFTGIESGDQETLGKIDKNQSIDDYLEFARKCAKCGLIPDYSFTLGYPGETDREIEGSFNLIKELKQITPSSTVMLYRYTPYFNESFNQDKFEFPGKWEDWGNVAWRSFSLTGSQTNWMTPEIYKKIRDFEAVLSCRYYRDEKVFPQSGTGEFLIEMMIKLARNRWDNNRFESPVELRLLRRLFLAMNGNGRKENIAT